MRRRLPLFALAAIFAAACNTPQPVDLEAARASLRETSANYAKAMNGRDAAAFAAFYASDAAMYPPGEATQSGLDAIRKYVEPFVADSAFSGKVTPVSVEVSADGTLGWTLDITELTFTGPDKKVTTERFRDFHTWRKAADGTWKLVVDMWNADATAEEEAAEKK